MKLYVDFLTNKVEIDRETPFYQSEDLVSKIEIDVANITGSYFVSLDFVLPNGHKLSVTTPDPFEDGEDTVVTRNGVTYSINRFTLSSLVLSCAGQLQFTAYANFTEEYTSGTQTLVRVIKKAALGNGVNTILKTANVLGGYILALDTDNASDVVKNLFDEIVRLTGLLSGKASISGSSEKSFQASEFTEGGITLVNKYHPKGGSGTLDFLVEKLTATLVNVQGTIDTTLLKLNGSDVTNLFHTKGGSSSLDFSAKDLTATNGYFTTLKKNNKDVAVKDGDTFTSALLSQIADSDYAIVNKAYINELIKEHVKSASVSVNTETGTYTMAFKDSSGTTLFSTSWDTPDEYIIDTTKDPETTSVYDTDGNLTSQKTKIFLYGGRSFTIDTTSIALRSESTDSDLVKLVISNGKIKAVTSETLQTVASNEATRVANETARQAAETTRKALYDEMIELRDENYQMGGYKLIENADGTYTLDIKTI